jgi:hypothetical protein
MVDEDNLLVPEVDYTYATSKNFHRRLHCPAGMEGYYGRSSWAPRSEFVQYPDQAVPGAICVITLPRPTWDVLYVAVDWRLGHAA